MNRRADRPVRRRRTVSCSVARLLRSPQQQVLSGSPAAEAPRARKFLMCAKGPSLTMEDIPYRALLESLGWTQARAGAFLGVSRQTSTAFGAGPRGAPATTVRLLPAGILF